MDRGKELRVGHDPAVGLDRVGGPNTLSDLLRRIDVADRQVDGRDTPDHPKQRWSSPQRGERGALVDAFVAEINRTGDRQYPCGATGRLEVELVTDGGAEVLGKLDANDDVFAGQPCLARHDVVRDPDDP